MERSRVTLATVICVLLSRISGAEVEMRVRPGDDVTLYSDCVWKTGFHTVWFRNCSHEHQPPLIISATAERNHGRMYANLLQNPFPRYISMWNSSSRTYHLLVKNVSESDLGLYYCALQETKITGRDARKDVFQYGKRTTRLSLLDTTPSTPPVSDCSVCWKLLVSVCPVCVLLSSTCVYCICRHTTKGRKKHGKVEDERADNKKSTKRNKVEGDDVCYASLDLPSRRQKHLKKKRAESFEFSTYSEVKTDRS